MNKVFKFKQTESVPTVFARIYGKNDDRRVRLVFDTGAAMSQLSTVIIESLGYSARDAVSRASAHGPSGPMDEGYALHLEELVVFGKRFQQPLVAAFDFDHLQASQIGGLLGFDIIKQLHLEMNGPKGELIIFDE